MTVISFCFISTAPNRMPWTIRNGSKVHFQKNNSHSSFLSNFHLVPDTEIVLTDKPNCHWLHWNSSIISLCLGASTFIGKIAIYESGDREIQFFWAFPQIILLQQPQTNNSFFSSLEQQRDNIHNTLSTKSKACLWRRQVFPRGLFNAWGKQENKDISSLTAHTLNTHHIAFTFTSLLLAQY